MTTSIECDGKQSTLCIYLNQKFSSAKVDRIWSDGYAQKVIRHLEIHVFPWGGHKPIENILPTEIVGCLYRPKNRGNLETAHRVREAVQHVYQYAVDVGALEPVKNFVNKDTGGLPPSRGRHFAAITEPAQLGQLLRDSLLPRSTFVAKRLFPMLPTPFRIVWLRPRMAHLRRSFNKLH